MIQHEDENQTGTLPVIADDYEDQLKAAHMLRAVFAHSLMFVENLGWHGWSGKQWVQDDYAARIRLYELALRVKSSCDHEVYILLNKGKNITAVAQMAEPLMRVSVDQLDADPYLFNTPDGVLDLHDGSVKAHDSKYLMTKLANGSYRPGGESVITTKFLAEVLPDHDLRRYAAQLAGLATFGGVRERIFPIFHGAGKNGKTTLVEAMLWSFGAYGVSLDTEVILAGKAHDEKKIMLRGARLALVSETETGARLKMAFIKDATSNATMKARPLYKKQVEWRVSHTFFSDTNHLPKANGSDKAAFDRIRVVRFDQDFDGREDKLLSDKLRAEADAVLTWAVDGWLDYQASGELHTPKSVMLATAAYKGDMDTVGGWLDELAIQSDQSTERGKLFDSYRFFCMGEHVEKEDVLKASDFYVALERQGYVQHRDKHGRYFRGLHIYSPAPVAS